MEGKNVIPKPLEECGGPRTMPSMPSSPDGEDMVSHNRRREALRICWTAGFVSIAVMVAVGLVGCGTVHTGASDADHWPDGPDKPWEELETPESVAVDGWDDDSVDVERRGTRTGFLDLGFWFYARGLTQIDGPRCEHRPTCSIYAFRAVGKHGFFFGTMMAVDRLMRGTRSSIHRRLPPTRTEEGYLYFHDPVEENDFFL